MVHLSKTTLFLILVILIIVASFSVGSFLFLRKDLTTIEQKQNDQYVEHQRTNQFLLSTVDWSSRRQKTILFLRDKIVEERSTIKDKDGKVKDPMPLEKAYLIAEQNVIEVEKYPMLDASLILAIQRVESCFRDTAVSDRGAIGLMQLMPSTARLLCGYFNLEYNDSLLYDTKTNIMLGVKLLDVLTATYGVNRRDLILADYNGGPYTAFYYRSKSSLLSPETAKFVPDVINKCKQYQVSFEHYKVDLVALRLPEESSNIAKSKVKMK